MSENIITAEQGSTAHAGIVNAMRLGKWNLADSLALGLADAAAQGDFDAVYGAAYAEYLASKR